MLKVLKYAHYSGLGARPGRSMIGGRVLAATAFAILLTLGEGTTFAGLSTLSPGIA